MTLCLRRENGKIKENLKDRRRVVPSMFKIKEYKIMITGELKNKIDRLWETFWTGGITNPLDVVEQMTYLMFIHDLDATDNQRAKESAMLGLPHKSIFAGEVQVGERTIPGSQLKWPVFHDFPAGQMYAVIAKQKNVNEIGAACESIIDVIEEQRDGKSGQSNRNCP